MTVGDLVRNEIFSRVAAEHPDAIEQIDQHHWQPFYKKFQQDGKNLFDSYFFPYGLIRNPNLTKSQVYNTLREEWRNTPDPRTIIEDLSRYQNAFIDIACGTNLVGHGKRLARQFRNLWLSGMPSSTYPFLMQLSKAVQDGILQEKDAVEVLEVIESFLIRRAVCGHEPTGLHAVFKRLWADCNGKPNKDLVKKEISKHKTVVWPDDYSFAKAIQARPLYGANITQYVLLEYDKSLGGDQPDNIPWVEHILPENPAKEWFETFTREQHHSLKDLLANLIPLSQAMNASLSNKTYDATKRERYGKDSMFKTARTLADTYEQWTPETIEMRGKDLANWAVRRWPF